MTLSAPRVSCQTRGGSASSDKVFPPACSHNIIISIIIQRFIQGFSSLICPTALKSPGALFIEWLPRSRPKNGLGNIPASTLICLSCLVTDLALESAKGVKGSAELAWRGAILMQTIPAKSFHIFFLW